MTARGLGLRGGALFALLLGAAPLAAQKQPIADTSSTGVCAPEPVRSVCYVLIDAEYRVLRSGDVDVAQRFTVRFNGEWNGIELAMSERATRHDFRATEERSARPESGYRDIDIEPHAAADLSGNRLRLESESTGGEEVIRIWVPDARDRVADVVLTYRIHDAVTFIGDTDEFYWNVWSPASTAHVAAIRTVVVPPEGATGLRADAFAGEPGTRQRAAVSRVEDGRIVAESTAPVMIGQDFTIAAGWDGGIVDRPGPLARFGAWLQRWWSLGLPFLAFALMWRRWSRRGRDPAMLPIVTQYEPPAGITPGEVGTLLDERADMRDVTATLVDLAVQGRLRIDETEGTKVFGLEFGEDYRFVETVPEGSPRAALPHEQRLLSALFSGRSQVELGDLKNEFYKDLPEIREAMMGCLVSQGVYTKRPDRERAAWAVGGVVLGFVLFFLLGIIPGTAAVALLTVPLLTAAPVVIFGWLMPRRTVKGTRLIERLRGFREFLERVDGDRLRRMKIEPDAFERILPYAMALGVEKKWGEAFEGLAQEPPRWYHTRNGRPFRPSVFAGDLGRMSTAAASTMSSRPNSSGGGGSGFGGGGSVGGGGGGTRGGGF